MSTERDELAQIIAQHDDYWPDHIADAILAAGYRKPRTVTTAAELDALAVGSVVLDGDGDVARKFRDGWWAMVVEPYDSAWLSGPTECIALPVTVLHEPEEEQ